MAGPADYAPSLRFPWRAADESDGRAMMGGAPDKKDVVVYGRVSSAGQKDDRASQVAAREMYGRSAAIPVDQWIQEVGSGMNCKRKPFLSIVERIQRGEIAKLWVAHKDRLMRLGFDLFHHIAAENGCEIIVVNQESLSPQQERVEDLMAIVHTFSGRLYGLRKYKKQLREDSPEYPIKEPLRISRNDHRYPHTTG